MSKSKRTFLRSLLLGILSILPIAGLVVMTSAGPVNSYASNEPVLVIQDDPFEPAPALPEPQPGTPDDEIWIPVEPSSYGYQEGGYRGQVNYSNQGGYAYSGPHYYAYQPYDYAYPYRGYSYYPYQDYYQYYNYNWGW